MNKIVYFAILVFGINVLIGAAQISGTVKPVRTWTGSEVDNEWLERRKNDSASGAVFSEAVLNENDWVELWRAWRSDEAPPKIDFARNLVLFCTTRTPNHCSIEPRLSRSGDLKVKILTTLIHSQATTFDYKIIVIKRAGIKTINGKFIVPNGRTSRKGSFVTAQP